MAAGEWWVWVRVERQAPEKPKKPYMIYYSDERMSVVTAYRRQGADGGR